MSGDYGMSRRELRASSQAATSHRDYRGSSALREQRESSAARDVRGSSMFSTTSRNIRASSVLPASLRHYDELAEADEEYISGSGYLNRGLHQAKRALSEAREILRGSSLARESSVSRYESSMIEKEKHHQLRQIQEISREDMLRERRENRGTHETGTYKITVTPQADSWSTNIPRRLYTRSTVAALLAAYSPRNFPDFIFGRYHGSSLKQPLSSTSDYYEPTHFDSTSYSNARAASTLDSMTASSKGYHHLDRATSEFRGNQASLKHGRSMYEDEDFQQQQAQRSSRASTFDQHLDREKTMDDLYNSRHNRSSTSRFNMDYNNLSSLEDSSTIFKDKRRSKFYHYFIPKHYPGTPMLGGYLVNTGRDYGWKY